MRIASRVVEYFDAVYADTEAGGNALVDCIHAVISRLVAELCMLPVSVVILFHAMEDSLHEDNSDPLPRSSESVGLRVCVLFVFFCGHPSRLNYGFCIVHLSFCLSVHLLHAVPGLDMKTKKHRKTIIGIVRCNRWAICQLKRLGLGLWLHTTLYSCVDDWPHNTLALSRHFCFSFISHKHCWLADRKLVKPVALLLSARC